MGFYGAVFLYEVKMRRGTRGEESFGLVAIGKILESLIELRCWKKTL